MRSFKQMAKAGRLGPGSFITVFITILVAVTLFNPVTEAIAGANATGTDSTVLNLVRTMYVLLVLGIVAVELKQSF